MDDPEPLAAIGRHRAVFEAPDFQFGSWVHSTTRPDGVITLGWYQPSPEAEAFLADVRRWITPFDWAVWACSPAGQALLGDPGAVASASADDLRRMLTVYVRSERMGDGALDAAFRNGMLTAIARRAEELAPG